MNYYQILRLRPDIDIQGKSESEISAKIEKNLTDIQERLKKMGKSKEAYNQESAQLLMARDVLINPDKRAVYDEQLKNEDVETSLTYVLLSPEDAEELKAQGDPDIEWLDMDEEE